MTFTRVYVLYTYNTVSLSTAIIRFTILSNELIGDIKAITSPGLAPFLFQCSLLTQTISSRWDLRVEITGFKVGCCGT